MTILEDIDKIVDKYTEDYINATWSGATLEFFVTVYKIYGAYVKSIRTDSICVDGIEIYKSWIGIKVDETGVDCNGMGTQWKAPAELQKLVRDRLLSQDKYKRYDPSTLTIYVDHFTLILK